jgi:hypothetical protein
MNICLLEDLQTGEYDTAFFLTYTINLRFFEVMILPRLKRMGVSRIGILIDQRGYQESLTDPLAQEFCGQEYILAPIRLSGGGIQHAKLLWLQKHENITAYLGSHNLTMAGYNDQLEITAKLTSADLEHIPALRDLHVAVSSIVPSSLQFVWEHTKPPLEANNPSSVIALTSLRRSLFDQITEYIPTADELRVVSPFLDVVALKKLVDTFQIVNAVLDLPEAGADIPVIQAIEAVPFLQARFLQGRRLHAKAYQFAASHSSWLAIGSANCSQAALMKSVAEGGNFEFLLILKDTVLPDDLNFTTIPDPENFPHTGRNWDTDLLPSTPIIIEEASYKEGQLSVKWLPREEDVLSKIVLDANERSIQCNNQTAISVPLDLPPQFITLKMTINGSVFETRAWVINYSALNTKVSQTKLHRWVERIASDDPRQHADSIALWLEQGIQELLQAHHEVESESIPIGPTLKDDIIQKIHQSYEIFTFSADPEEIRANARSLLRNYPNVDPLVLLRVLLMRFVAEPPNDVAANSDEYDVSSNSDMQYYLRRRKSAIQIIVNNLSRQLDRLIKIKVSNTVSEHTFAVGLRTLLGAIPYICLSVLEESALKDAENLTQHFICLLKWLVSQPTVKHEMQKPQLQGPLLLSIGAITIAAERCRDQTLYKQLRLSAMRLVEVDPRQVIDNWKRVDPEGIDRFRNLSGKGVIWQQIEPYALRLFGIPPVYLMQLVENRWGSLLALQGADLYAKPERTSLYIQAKAKYIDTEIWDRYDKERDRINRLPLIFQVNGKFCPNCYLGLSQQTQLLLRRGEAVKCDNCNKFLIQKA